MKYLIVDSACNEEPPVLCDTEEEALQLAEIYLQQNPYVTDVSIYRLHKTGKRQSVVRWEDEVAVSRGTTMEIPPRPPYRGPHRRWSNDEVTYLKEAKNMGMSFEGIANKLGRSTHAVELKYSRI